MKNPRLTRSERRILTGLDNLTEKTARREVLRRWAKLTPRGSSLVLERMMSKLLIAKNSEGIFTITFRGMMALAEQPA